VKADKAGSRLDNARSMLDQGWMKAGQGHQGYQAILIILYS